MSTLQPFPIQPETYLEEDIQEDATCWPSEEQDAARSTRT